MLAQIQEPASIKPTLYVGNASDDPNRNVGLSFELDDDRLIIIISETKKGGRTYRYTASLELATMLEILERLNIAKISN